MKMSRRAKRMERQHKRGRRLPSFNLVALMDIFTILVFFLLVNSSDVEVLPNTKSLKLPESVANKKPEETLVVMVNNKDILVGGKKIASVQAVMASPALVIQPLKAELDYQSKRSRVTTPEGTKAKREITIMGDRNIPFELLKKVMVTCARANYTKISLAVLKKTLK
ncbi:MAG: biopolymer transporter ExbD [Proteobacteria bacterium]|nr:MAG: biopolymer transporter ExbD [Pseudomonadota bacterium]TDJ74938.1 MAG: biopolymer transporter ExbD [Pseudomonadota bacterium]